MDGDFYTVINGMTWEEWCESEYNYDGYYCSNGFVYSSNNIHVNYTGIRFVNSSDKIEAVAYRLSDILDPT